MCPAGCEHGVGRCEFVSDAYWKAQVSFINTNTDIME